jgi:hypothetical protein
MISLGRFLLDITSTDAAVGLSSTPTRPAKGAMGLSSSFWALAFLGVLGQQSVLGQEMGSKERPARSCHEILLERGMVADGYQHLRLPSGRSIKVFCLMSRGGYVQLAGSRGEVNAPPMPAAEWTPILSDFFAGGKSARIIADGGARDDGFAVDEAVDGAPAYFYALLKTLEDLPFREVLLFDGKSYLAMETIRTTGEAQPKRRTLKQVVADGGSEPLFHKGANVGVMSVLGDAKQKGEASCYYPNVSGRECDKWFDKDDGASVTAFHVGDLAKCTNGNEYDGVHDALWGRQNCYHVDAGGGFGGFTYFRQYNAVSVVEGGFERKRWGVYVRDTTVARESTPAPTTTTAPPLATIPNHTPEELLASGIAPEMTDALRKSHGACINGVMAVHNGWHGAGFGPNYCNTCTCHNTKLSCTRQACDPKAAGKPCKRTGCRYGVTKTGAHFEMTTVVHHHQDEPNGAKYSCGHNKAVGKCSCMCFDGNALQKSVIWHGQHVVSPPAAAFPSITGNSPPTPTVSTTRRRRTHAGSDLGWFVDNMTNGGSLNAPPP